MRAMTTQTKSATSPTNGNSKSDQVRALLQAGVAPGQVAKQVGCSRNLVYMIKAGGTASGKPHTNTTEQPVTKGIDADIDRIVSAIRQNQRETEALRGGLPRVQQIVADLLR